MLIIALIILFIVGITLRILARENRRKYIIGAISCITGSYEKDSDSELIIAALRDKQENVMFTTWQPIDIDVYKDGELIHSFKVDFNYKSGFTLATKFTYENGERTEQTYTFVLPSYYYFIATTLFYIGRLTRR